MAYTSLANKYRPQTFSEVIGQESISTTLMNAVKSGRIAHAYLFYGPRGCGKTTTARILAKALNCEHGPTAEPCGKCPQCQEIASSSDMDVLELDAASNTQVDKVREAIIETVSLASGRDRYKIFILDEVHMLSDSSFNALLKTLEEPPDHVVFILATTELHEVPLTIVSRCQTFRFKPIPDKVIADRLVDLANAENIDITDEAALLIAKNAGGALRDGLTILDRVIAFSNGKIDEELVSKTLGLLPKDLVQKTALALVNQDEKGLHSVFDTIKKEGFDSLSLLKDLKNVLGEIFYFSMGASVAPFKEADEILKKSSPSFIAGLTRKISKLYDEVRYSDTQALSAEVGLFTIMQNSVDLGALIARLEALENGEVSSNNDDNNGNTQESEPEEIQEEEEETNKKNLSSETEIKPKQTQKKTLNPIDALNIFKKGLAETYPFVADIIHKAKVIFVADDLWRLEFDDKFLYESCLSRIKDMENLAKNLFDKTINFDIIIKEEVITTPRTIEVLKNFTTPKQTSKTEQTENDNTITLQNANEEDKNLSERTKFLMRLFDAQIISK